MKVTERSLTPNGIAIQIENWNDNYSFMPINDTLAAYPKSKHSLQGSFSPKLNKEFRVEFRFKSANETKEAFNSLINGTKILADYTPYIDKQEYAICL